MKHLIKFLMVAVIMVAYSVSANAQGSATTNGTAAARIIAPITLTAGNTLNFGVIFNTAAGTVTVTTGSVRSSVGAVLSPIAPAAAAGTFTVGGEAGLTYTITLPGSATIAAGVPTMTINGFNHNATLTVPETFSVGAVLSVGAAQPSGSYTGTYPVTVAYN